MKRTIFWTVFPEDPYILPMDFDRYEDAKEWAASLCCSYTIEEAC